MAVVCFRLMSFACFASVHGLFVFAPVCSRLLWLATVCSMGSLVFLFDVVCFRLCFWKRIGCSISEVTQGEQIVTIRWRIRQFLFLLKRHTVFVIGFCYCWLRLASICSRLLEFAFVLTVCLRLLPFACASYRLLHQVPFTHVGSHWLPCVSVCCCVLPFALVWCRLLSFIVVCFALQVK